MIDLRERHPGPELMDQQYLPPEDLKQNLKELETINRWLGGHNCTFYGLSAFKLQPSKTYRILDIACGGGDTIRAVERWSHKQGLKFEFTGLDSSSTAISFSKDACRHIPNAQFICEPFEQHQPIAPYDIVMCSLFTHHLYEEQLSLLLKHMKAYSTLGFTINDLERNHFAYFGIRLLTQVMSKSYLVKHDAPLSVRRGFTKSEWRLLLKNNGLQHASVRNVWAFRHAITYIKSDA